jgi:hypothetical protein
MNKTKAVKKLNKTPSISFFNKYLINSIDITKDSDSNNNISNKTCINSPNNPLKDMKYSNKSKKELLLAKLDTTHLRKKNKNKQEGQKAINKTINYDDSEGFLMAAKLSSSFMTDRNLYDSHIYYPKKKLRHKIETEIFSNNNNTKEKTSYISDVDLFDAFPLERYNRQMDEQISSTIKIQSIWRRYQSKKLLVSMKLTYFVNLINRFINNCKYKKIKGAFNLIKNSKKKKKIIYYKKLPDKNKILLSNEKIKHSNSFRMDDLLIEENINQITILDSRNKSCKRLAIYSDKKYNKNVWIEFPFSIEKYVTKIIKIRYYNSFLEKFKSLYKEKLKERQKTILLKLMHRNNMKIIKRYMNKYKEKVIIEKTKQNIYSSLIRKQPKFKTTKKVNSFFNFQCFYKQNIFQNLVKKYRYTSLVQKYYFLWKKKTEEQKKNKIKDDNKIKVNKVNNKNKKKKVIKIKRIKKKPEEHYELNDFNNCKEDTISNVSGISLNNSGYNSNISNSIQGCLAAATTRNKKMRIKKITVDHNYYEFVENNNNFYTNFK